MVRNKWNLKSTGLPGNSQKASFNGKKLISQINCRLWIFCYTWKRKKKPRICITGLLCIITNCSFIVCLYPTIIHHSKFLLYYYTGVILQADVHLRKKKRLSRLFLSCILALASWIYYIFSNKVLVYQGLVGCHIFCST